MFHNFLCVELSPDLIACSTAHVLNADPWTESSRQECDVSETRHVENLVVLTTPAPNGLPLFVSCHQYSQAVDWDSILNTCILCDLGVTKWQRTARCIGYEYAWTHCTWAMNACKYVIGNCYSVKVASSWRIIGQQLQKGPSKDD